jgi:carbonic anhydrase
MKRRAFLKGLGAMALCPLCAGPGFAADGGHQHLWSYEGDSGPDRWGALSPDNATCSVGAQQSPIDISGAIDADLPQLVIGWEPGTGTLVNNGHTIQCDLAAGGTLTRGDRSYRLVQFHLHAPGEHTVDGKHFPMEAHFVHKDDAGGLAVLGVFLVPGAANAVYGALASAFPQKAGETAAIDIDPRGLLPGELKYWAYRGSLTTPPCSEIVEWMVLKAPLEVAEQDIARFTSLYPMNARPTLAGNRRFILSSR